MKVLMINVVCGIRSTGRICTDLAAALEAQGHEVKIAYGREDVPEQFQKYAVRIGNDLDVKLHGLKARLMDGAGFGSKRVTEKFIKWVKEYDPDVIHLHNIHGYYINVEVLFKYLKECGKKIIWTLHDCWSFTGHCVYFDYVNCNKWETECHKCPNLKGYPATMFVDRSKDNFARKKQTFTSVDNITFVTPSHWLKNIVKRSFLSVYPVRVIHNGVDLAIFKPVASENIKIKYGLNVNNKIILGVASTWDRRKGLTDFIQLSQLLAKNEQIVLVGLSSGQIRSLPKGIIGINRTENVNELAALYSMADVFVNPTWVDNFPTTNIEALACGTPVVTYQTGGSPEAISQDTGRVVEKGNISALYQAISEILSRDSVCYQTCCRQRAEILFNKEERYQDYIELYKSLL